MDPEERALKERELDENRAFREREFEERAHARKFSRISALIAAGTVILSAIAVFNGIVSSTNQTRLNDAQFKKNVRNTTYNIIVTGLGSSSAAVQTNSMRLLRQYAKDPSNYDSAERQQEGIVNAIQTLTAFIEDNSDTSNGLVNYESPQPIVLPRAMNQVKLLVSEASLGSHDADISRANLHGISLPYLAPKGSFFAVAADFRRADLNHLDLSKTPESANIRRAFFTCATLSHARFGKANVAAADFSGADLSDADLSQVKNLDSQQLHGVKVSPGTRLPKGVQVTGTPWKNDPQKCSDVSDEMTGMLQGQGYDPAIPCPTKVSAWGDSLARRRFKGDMRNLVAVCTARIG